jgi:hypothetical protein
LKRRKYNVKTIVPTIPIVCARLSISENPIPISETMSTLSSGVENKILL